MVFIFILIIILISVGTIAYPLYKKELQRHMITNSSTNQFNNNFWLSALSDLDDDFSLGRVSEKDYKKQKLKLQHSYLNSREKS